MKSRERRTYPDLATFFNESGVSQGDFAKRIHKSQSYVSKVRHGRLEPSIVDALRISKEAGVPLESLARRQPELSEA